MKRIVIGSLAVFVLIAARVAVERGAAPLPAQPAPATAASPSPLVEASPEIPAPGAPPAPAPASLPEDHDARVRQDPVLSDRARQHELAAAADARWHDAVDRAGYRAGDLDPAVRDLFDTLDLEPRYAEDGGIEGLDIRGLAPGHPLARAGFRPGDRIDRIQGVPLRDPAELPSLLARLGPHFSLCALRDGSPLCREIELD